MSAEFQTLKTVERIDRSSYRVRFDAKMYSSLAVKKSAYKYAAHFSAIFTVADVQTIVAEVKFVKGDSEADQEEIIHAFLNEVIDQDLREQIARETEATRNLILAEAFSKTSLLHEEG